MQLPGDENIPRGDVFIRSKFVVKDCNCRWMRISRETVDGLATFAFCVFYTRNGSLVAR